MKHTINKPKAFTIVELLIVIVIIGILATISIVSYVNISQKAIIASIQSDLSYSQKRLNLYLVDNIAYPNSVIDCPTPSSGSICLKPSSGNVISSYSANNSTNPKTYSITIMRGNLIYTANSDTVPSVLASAPLSPVADWLAMAQGDHYGGYYDLVSKQWATVTRTTPKTIYDPTTNRIYDVPANKLGINPRSDGKNGAEALIEESRTNYLLNSYGAASTGGAWNSWSFTEWGAAQVHPTYSETQGVYSNTAQRIVAHPSAGSPCAFRYHQTTAEASFSPGETAVATLYMKGTINNVSGVKQVLLEAVDSSNTTLGTVLSNLPIQADNFIKYTLTYSNLPANTTKVRPVIYLWGITDISVIDITFDAIQVEKGVFPTSYIPTTTTTATRNRDSVTVPTSTWAAAQGTIFGVAGEPASFTNNPAIISWRYNDAERIWLDISSSNIALAQTSGGGSQSYATNSNPATYDTFTGRWSVGQLTKLFVNNIGTNSSVVLAGAPNNLPNSAIIGDYQGTTTFNGPLQRFTTYNTPLSDVDVGTVTNFIKDGPK